MTTKAQEERDLVVSYMCCTGENFGKLTSQQHTEVYLLGDGFGTIDFSFANEQCFDWSHVRDSSPAAFARMAAHIRQLTI